MTSKLYCWYVDPYTNSSSFNLRNNAAYLNPLRWSKYKHLREVCEEIELLDIQRGKVYIKRQDGELRVFLTVGEAYDFLIQNIFHSAEMDYPMSDRSNKHLYSWYIDPYNTFSLLNTAAYLNPGRWSFYKVYEEIFDELYAIEDKSRGKVMLKNYHTQQTLICDSVTSALKYLIAIDKGRFFLSQNSIHYNSDDFRLE